MLLWPNIRSYYLQIPGGSEESHNIQWAYHISVPSRHDCEDIILAPGDCNKCRQTELPVTEVPSRMCWLLPLEEWDCVVDPHSGAWVFVFVLSSVDSETLRQTDPPSTENIICLRAVELTSENVISWTVVVCARNRRTE